MDHLIRQVGQIWSGVFGILQHIGKDPYEVMGVPKPVLKGSNEWGGGKRRRNKSRRLKQRRGAASRRRK